MSYRFKSLCRSVTWPVLAFAVTFSTLACERDRKTEQQVSPQRQEAAPPASSAQRPVPVQQEKEPALKVLRQSAGTTQLTIDEIVTNDHIAGHVVGLAPDAVGTFKVVVYVHTNQWYIHPYAGQGKGGSWASVSSDLKWSLGTVKREFPADQVAALLLHNDTEAPATVPNIVAVPSVSWVVVEGNGQL